MLGTSACVISLRLFTCVEWNQLATPRRHVAYHLSFWMKWSVFMIMTGGPTGIGNPFLSAEKEICSSMSVLASCVSTNVKNSFYSTHLQVRFTVVSENRSAAISMWFKSNTHIQPTPLLCPRFQVLFRVDVQNYISMVVIWAFIEIHNVQGYLWSENVDALVGGTIWMVAAMSTNWTAALLILQYWRDLLAYLYT